MRSDAKWNETTKIFAEFKKETNIFEFQKRIKFATPSFCSKDDADSLTDFILTESKHHIKHNTSTHKQTIKLKVNKLSIP